MYCLICSEPIKCGQEVFFGIKMKCLDSQNDELEYISDQEDFNGSIHMYCLSNILENDKIDVVEEDDSKEIVKRSDAISLFAL